MKKLISLLVITLIILIEIVSCSTEAKKPQPELGFRTVTIIEENGLKFKDLNKNSELDKYEDWRLSADERSEDLLSKMSLEEKAGFMLINSLNMVGTRAAEASEGKLKASDLSENGGGGFGGGGGSGRDRQQDSADSTMRNNPNRTRQDGARGGTENRDGAFIANMNRSGGTTDRVKKYHNRHFILRSNESANVTAEWANKLQELCENEPLGIPAIIASNPRNHITTNPSLGTSVGTTVFTSWPGELGLSAMRDLSLVREFADDSRQEWAAVGLRKGYMYMADLATEPRWSRTNGTFGENSEWVANMMREIVLGFQGEKLHSKSVALTTKHFPGGGSGKDGQDSHFEWGKAEVYPGGMFDNNLIPFQAAIDAGTSSIMPYYSLPEGTKYEEVGFAFNKGVITDVLRTKMGFKGIINSDTGPLTRQVWGVENLTKEERYKKSIEAGVNLFSGESDPEMLIEVIKSGMVDMALIDSSVVRLLKEKFELGLFENPYVDLKKAENIVTNESFRESAALAMRKSIVLLRNENDALPVKPKTKVYFESFPRNSRGRYNREPQPDADVPNVYTLNNNQYEIEFVKTPEEAELVMLWIQPSGNSTFRSTGEPVSISLSKCGVNVDYVNGISAKKPTILVINYTNPWVINEVYNEETKNVVGVLATFGTTPGALLDVITGKFNPTGKMPFSTPISDEAVENNLEDVPGYLEGEGYALFNYDEGMSYKMK
ncbi:glycoside hydrolase family 3 C-terminal domain-containing protein [Draconibacterium sp.]|nr:glycoside hydrolase family 3 C-terminal domain-containing protein [Draconibacterium sp.]